MERIDDRFRRMSILVDDISTLWRRQVVDDRAKFGHDTWGGAGGGARFQPTRLFWTLPERV
jgi:hypothetical protein